MNLTRTQPAFERYGKEVIKQARANLTRNQMNVTRELYRSLKYRVKVSQNSVEQSFTGSRYAAFQDRGVKGTKSSKRAPDSPFQFKSKMIPVEPILKWVSARKIQFRTPGGRFMSFKSTAFLIARSIPKKGLRATRFFSKPAERQSAKLSETLRQTLNVDFGKFVVNINN